MRCLDCRPVSLIHIIFVIGVATVNEKQVIFGNGTSGEADVTTHWL